MKKYLVIPLILFLYQAVNAQTDKFIYELPEYSTVVNDSTHIMYIDAGGIDKHIEMPTFLGVIHDSADQLRYETDTAKANIRAGMGGGGILQKTGNMVTLVNSDDSVNFGGSTSYKYKNFFEGSSRINGIGDISGINLRSTDGTYDDVQLRNVSGQLTFVDVNNATPTTLTTLKEGLFGLNGSTRYALSTGTNWHFGGIGTSTYKVKITGGFNVTQDAVFDADVTANTVLLEARNTYPSPATEGQFFYHTDSSKIVYYNGSVWSAIGTGGGGGTGTVTVSGTPVAGQLAYFTGPTNITCGSNLSLVNDTFHIGKEINAWDSIRVKMFGDCSNVWWTGTSTSALDTGHVEPAWWGLIRKLPKPGEVFNDQKEVDGHKEIRVYYVDDITGEIRYQYGFSGMSPTETASAFGILHETALRWHMQEQEDIANIKNAMRVLIVFCAAMFIGIIVTNFKKR